jgi:phosphopantetheinyl transferase
MRSSPGTALQSASTSSSELAELTTVLDRDLFVASLWCSKEALAKALGDAIDYDPRRLEAPSRWPAGKSGAWQAQALGVAAEHTAWLCWQAALADPARAGA